MSDLRLMISNCTLDERVWKSPGYRRILVYKVSKVLGGRQGGTGSHDIRSILSAKLVDRTSGDGSQKQMSISVDSLDDFDREVVRTIHMMKRVYAS